VRGFDGFEGQCCDRLSTNGFECYAHPMGKRRDPNFTTGHLCRFCGELVPWGTILRIIRVDPDTPPYMLG